MNYRHNTHATFISFIPFIYSISLTANVSLSVRSLYSWAASVPKDVFEEFVMPYGNVNEARNNFRPLIQQACQAILDQAVSEGQDLDAMSISDVALLINANLWTNNPVLGKNIVFKSSQTPLIYDPMSTLAFGYASCTGVSIFYVDALRSVGIPARIAGTPAWNGDAANGNHNWVRALFLLSYLTLCYLCLYLLFYC